MTMNIRGSANGITKTVLACALAIASATVAGATDTTPPTATITSPGSSSYLTTLTSISGTAADNAGGSGFSQAPGRVIITISRHMDGSWWNGSTWVSNSVHLSTTLSDNTGLNCNWERNYGLPSPWEESKYTIYAKAYDAAGNGSAADSHGVWVPAVAPTISITSPANNAAVNGLFYMTGTASDNPGGSGLNDVEVFFRRGTDNYYWNGSGWSSTRVGVLAALYWADEWDYIGPPSSQMTPGTLYYIGAYATDYAGIVGSAGITVRYATETIAPTVAITAPANNATLSSLTSVYGTASDNVGGIGLASVEVFLRRGSDNYYWTGTTWVSTRTGRFASISGSNWTYSTALPGALTPGVTYYMSAAAADYNANVAGTLIQFYGN